MKVNIITATGWFIILTTCVCSPVRAQENVEQLLEKENAREDSLRTEPVPATFESTRLIGGHSVETTRKRNLDFRISHRFDQMDEGFYDFFGLDNAAIRFGLDYGITDRLTVGAGRSSMFKEYDIPVTYKILRQTTGRHRMPVTMTLLGALMIQTLRDPSGQTSFDERLTTACQLLVARKFSSVISLQLMPIWIHYVQTPLDDDPNDILSVGVGGSIRLFKRVRLNVEYYPLFAGNKLTGTTAPLSIGFDMETGGHVFQLFVSNSIGTNERLLVTQTVDKWNKGQLHLCFNILRVFSL